MTCQYDFCRDTACKMTAFLDWGQLNVKIPMGLSNAPGDCFELTPSTIDASKRFFASKVDVPRQALTMGMQAKKVLLMVRGEDKAALSKLKDRRRPYFWAAPVLSCIFD